MKNRRKALLVRPAAAGDVRRLCELDAQYNRMLYAGAGEIAGENTMGQTRRFYSGILKKRGHLLLVAEQGGRAVAYVHATREDETGDLVRAPWGCIGAIVVDRKARRRGIGEALLGAVEAWAFSEGLTAVQLGVHSFNEGAIRFYEQAGYRPVMQLMQKDLPRRRRISRTSPRGGR